MIKIIGIIFIFSFSYGCGNKEYKDLPDENPSQITDISLTIVLNSKYDESYKEELIEICLPFRSSSCPTIAFVSKSVKIIRLGGDEKKSVLINTWDANSLNNIFESIQGKTFAGIAQNVEDNFNNFIPDDYLLSESSNQVDQTQLTSYLNKNKKAKVYFYTEPDLGNTKYQSESYSTVQELRTVIADNLCNNKKDNLIPIIILFKPNLGEDPLAQDYNQKIGSIKTSIEELPVGNKIVTQKGYDALIAKCDDLIKIADGLIKQLETNEREKQKKYLDDEILKLDKKLTDLKEKINQLGVGPKPPPPPPGLGTIVFPNGDKYVGEQKNGLMHGVGTYYFATRHIISAKGLNQRFADAGDVLKGSWNEGSFSAGKLYEHNGKFKETIIIGQ